MSKLPIILLSILAISSSVCFATGEAPWLAKIRTKVLPLMSKKLDDHWSIKLDFNRHYAQTNTKTFTTPSSLLNQSINTTSWTVGLGLGYKFG